MRSARACDPPSLVAAKSLAGFAVGRQEKVTAFFSAQGRGRFDWRSRSSLRGCSGGINANASRDATPQPQALTSAHPLPRRRPPARLRFFAPVKEFGYAFIARFTQIDYMAFIALDEASGVMLGVVRLHADANYERGEYAVLVRSDLKGRGLGYLLMQMIIEYARAEGIAMKFATYYDHMRTHISLAKDAPYTRPIERFGDVVAHPILGALHHRYART